MAIRQPEAKTPQLREVYFCCYCAIVSARILSNGGVLAGNKLMSGSTGNACCYVWPPLIRAKLFSLTYIDISQRQYRKNEPVLFVG